MGVTEAFADWIVSAKYEDVPAGGMSKVKQSILDWIGCALVGAARPEASAVVSYIDEQGGKPQARFMATGLRTTSDCAAFANGIMGHLEDFDDSGAHPASYLTPTVLALGEERRLSGQQVLLAWTIGYEISARIRAGLHMDRPWHTTAILGTPGATAAASKVLQLSSHKTRMALGIGTSETGGVMRNFGTMTKSLHPGNAARNGIVAAKMALHGFTADPEIIEGRYGFADCFGGEKCYLPAMTQFLGSVWFIAEKGPDIKVWPCCSMNHQSLTGIRALLATGGIRADDITRVEHYGPAVPGTGELIRREVHNGLDGKFCLEYNIAAAFVDGKVDLDTFSDERVKRGDLQAFMKKVYRYQNPEAALHSGRTKAGADAAWLRIHLSDGSVRVLQLGPRDTLKGEAVVEKFRANARPILGGERTERVVQLVRNLERSADVTELMDAVCPRQAA